MLKTQNFSDFQMQPINARVLSESQAARTALYRNVLVQATRRFVTAARSNLPSRRSETCDRENLDTRCFVARLARMERNRSKATFGRRRCRLRSPLRQQLTRKDYRYVGFCGEQHAQVDGVHLGTVFRTQPDRCDLSGEANHLRPVRQWRIDRVI